MSENSVVRSLAELQRLEEERIREQEESLVRAAEKRRRDEEAKRIEEAEAREAEEQRQQINASLRAMADLRLEEERRLAEARVQAEERRQRLLTEQRLQTERLAAVAARSVVPDQRRGRGLWALGAVCAAILVANIVVGMFERSETDARERALKLQLRAANDRIDELETLLKAVPKQPNPTEITPLPLAEAPPSPPKPKYPMPPPPARKPVDKSCPPGVPLCN